MIAIRKDDFKNFKYTVNVQVTNIPKTIEVCKECLNWKSVQVKDT